MPAKREQVLWQSVWLIAKKLEKSFGLTPMLSGAILAFDRLSAEEQKRFIAEANTNKQLEPSQKNSLEEEFRKRVLQIVEEAQVIPAKKKSARSANRAKSG